MLSTKSLIYPLLSSFTLFFCVVSPVLLSFACRALFSCRTAPASSYQLPELPDRRCSDSAYYWHIELERAVDGFT